MTNKVLFHGECVISQINQIPEDLESLQPENGYVRIAESEVTGNHHQVLVKDKDIRFYKKDGVIYARFNEPTTIGCVLKERHDDVILPVGCWKFTKAVEFDPIAKELMYVKD